MPKFSLSDSEEEKKEGKDEEEDDYSDSFEEVNNTVETVKQEEIVDLLKTANEQTLQILKQSLSNFSDAKKFPDVSERFNSSARKPQPQILDQAATSAGNDQARPRLVHQQTIEEDEYIEEDFEEDNTGSDEPIEEIEDYNDDAEDVERQMLRERRERQERERKEQEKK